MELCTVLSFVNSTNGKINMIKLSELKAGETVLTYKGDPSYKTLVLEVFSNTVAISKANNFEEVYNVLFTEKEISDHFNIYTEPTRIPEPTNYKKFPKVRVRNNDSHGWAYGYFLANVEGKNVPFIILNRNGIEFSFKYCEFYEWEE